MKSKKNQWINTTKYNSSQISEQEVAAEGESVEAMNKTGEEIEEYEALVTN